MDESTRYLPYDFLLEIEARAEMCAEATIPGPTLRALIAMAVNKENNCRRAIDALAHFLSLCDACGAEYGNAVYISTPSIREYRAALSQARGGKRGRNHEKAT